MKESYKFTKGDILMLDQIYTIQGVGSGKWWKHVNDDCYHDNVEIVHNVEITIITKEELGDD